MSDTRTQLEEERRIINAATEGPWETVTRRYSSDIGWYDASHIPGVVEDVPPSCDVEESAPLDPADANFIAHARTALPLRNAQVADVTAVADRWSAEGHSLLLAARGRGDLRTKWRIEDKACLLIKCAEEVRRAIEEAGA